jgi:glycosyltransferase involved in cell wall biosynthesis
MRVLALLPSFYGKDGSAVNERQLMEALASKVEKCYVVTFVGFRQVFTKQRKELKVSLPKNMLVIPLPLPEVNVIVVHLAMIIVSCVVSLIALILSILQKINLVYIRYSFLAIGFLTFRSLAEKTVVKIPAIIEDEISSSSISGFFIRKIAPFMDRAVLAKAKKVAVTSRTFYNMLVRRRSFTRSDEPLIIPAGVNLSLIEKVKVEISKSSLKDTVDIGFHGSLSWWQGVDILVKAVAILKEKVPNLRLVIIGDGELRSSLEKLCKSLDIHYEITGFLSHEDALKRLRTLDIMVLPRRKTPTTESVIPIKVIEAWALGVPVIVTKHQVFLDYQIRDYEDVIYCEPNPNSVANAILTLLINDELRKKLEMNGLKLARQFDYDKIAERLLKTYYVLP